MQTVLVETKEWNQIPYNLSYSQLLATMWLLEMNSGPLAEQSRLLTAEPSLRAHVLYLFLFYTHKIKFMMSKYT